MIGIMIVAGLVVASAAVARMARARWPRVLMASVLLATQVVILAFDFDVRARQVLVDDRQSGSIAPSSEVVRMVGEAQLVDRACAGLAGLGLFLLAVLNRRPQ